MTDHPQAFRAETADAAAIPSSWRDDHAFQEFGGETLMDPRSSGFSLIGAGGTYAEPDADGLPNVVVYLEELDSGSHLHASLTPESARLLAARLTHWADMADQGTRPVEEVIEAERAAWDRLY